MSIFPSLEASSKYCNFVARANRHIFWGNDDAQPPAIEVIEKSRKILAVRHDGIPGKPRGRNLRRFCLPHRNCTLLRTKNFTEVYSFLLHRSRIISSTNTPARGPLCLDSALTATGYFARSPNKGVRLISLLQ